MFYIDGFPDFTRQHTEILAHIIQYAPDVTICMNCPADAFLTGDVKDDVFVGLAFEKAHATARQILRIAKRAGVAWEITKIAPNPTALEPLRQKLFQGELQALLLLSIMRTTVSACGNCLQPCVNISQTD